MEVEILSPGTYRAERIKLYAQVALELLSLDIDRLTISITKFDELSESGKIQLGAVTVLSEDPAKPCRDFAVTLNEEAPNYQLRKTLCHELIHVQQFASGDLRRGMIGLSMVTIDKETGHECEPTVSFCDGWLWRGEVYPVNTEYKNRPWEAEAAAKELDFVLAADARFDERIRNLEGVV